MKFPTLSLVSKAGLLAFGAACLFAVRLAWKRRGDNEVPGPTAEVVVQPTTVTAEEALICQTEHVVKPGEFLRYIAAKHNVDAELVILANRAELVKRYDETCGELPEQYRTSTERRGTFCNDNYRRAYANTLRAGWKLCIPASDVPKSIEQVVAGTPGQEAVLVIDDTGSMGDDRTTVAALYHQALTKHGRDVVGIFMYADRKVSRVTNIGDAQVSGDFENTFEAIQTAVREAGPDIVYLITDEPGDDWPEQLENLGFPTVVATCLQDDGVYACEEPLKRLAVATNGIYVPLSVGQ